MADYLKDLFSGITITEDIIGTSNRTPSLIQVISQALNGAIYIQNIGTISYQVTASFLIHEDNDALLNTAYEQGHPVEVSDDDKVYTGYIISMRPSLDCVDGYHECSVVLQEEGS